MALKTQKVKHIILQQDIEELNQSVAKLIEDGWKLLEARVQRADFVNNFYVVFYIFVKDA